MKSNTKVSLKEFRNRLDSVFNGRITFKDEDWLGYRENMDFFCTEHGERFSRQPALLLRTTGCSVCRKQRGKYKSKSKEKFLKEVAEVHGDRFDYSNAEFKSYTDKVEIKCVKHSEVFWQSPSKHVFSQGGCPSCKLETIASHHKHSKEEFVAKAREVHGDKYNYSEVEYVNCDTNVKIYCKRHKDYFMQTPYSHTRGSSCPKCSIEDNHGSFGRKGVYTTDRESYIYLVEMCIRGDYFLKVGLSVTPKDRWKRMSKYEGVESLKPIATFKGKAKDLSRIENEILWKCGLEKFLRDDWSWSGRTECFNIEDKYKILSLISSRL